MGDGVKALGSNDPDEQKCTLNVKEKISLNGSSCTEAEIWDAKVWWTPQHANIVVFLVFFILPCSAFLGDKFSFFAFWILADECLRFPTLEWLHGSCRLVWGGGQHLSPVRFVLGKCSDEHSINVPELLRMSVGLCICLWRKKFAIKHKKKVRRSWK